MNSVVFLEWFENQLMAALKNPSLVVLDNASYHNVKSEDTVCPNFSRAVILVNPCFIHVHDIIPCFPKRFDLSQIITPIINNKHLIVQNSSIITAIGVFNVFLYSQKYGTIYITVKCFISE
jgi:hypothetical protein